MEYFFPVSPPRRIGTRLFINETEERGEISHVNLKNVFANTIFLFPLWIFLHVYYVHGFST